MSQYYPLRRMPQMAPRGELLRKLRGLVLPVLKSSAWSLLAVATPSKLAVKPAIDEKARDVGDQAFDRLQLIYFNNPGLDTVTVRALTKTGRDLAQLARGLLIGQIAIGRDKNGLVRRQMKLLPKTGYESLMISGLVVGTALGYFRGGPVASLVWWDSADPDPSKRRKLPPGHPYPGVRRFQAPQSLGDMAADIDDLYWAGAYGQAIKVTRVGTGQDRRWLVSLPGTDHGEIESENNPADIESNLREQLNIASAARLGAISAIRASMYADGLSREEMLSEHVLIVGHSQGGMIAVALASADPKSVGFTVDGVVTMGSPTRRLRVRDDVTMLAVEHDQDMIPSLDATPRREADQRVVVKRKLNTPKSNPLFYAHSSSTYTETLRATELKNAVAPWGRVSDVVEVLHGYLPKPGEETRVTHHYAWQELIEPTKRSAFDAYLDIRPTDNWQPVTYGDEVEVPSPIVANPVDLVAQTTAFLGRSHGEDKKGQEVSSDE